MVWGREVAVGTTHGGCRNMVFREAAVKRRPRMRLHRGFQRRAERYTLRLLAVALVYSGLMQCAIAQSWQALPRAPIRTDRHEDVFFIDAERGWVVNRDGEVHRTTDGGASWQLGFQEPDAFFRSVVFTDSLRGWVGSLFSQYPLYATTDGGITFVPVADLTAPVPTGICGFWAVNAATVYGCGTYEGPARLVKTHDGGAHWTTIDMSPWAATLVDVHFVSPDSGFVVGGRGAFPHQSKAVVLWTADGGVSWTTRYLGSESGLWGWKISFPSRSTGYVSLESGHNAPVFLKTTDGGKTWIEGDFVNVREQGIGFATENLGWIGGSPLTTYRTEDGGLTWVSDPFGRNVNSFHMLSPTLGYAVGRTVYKFSMPTVVSSKSISAVKGVFR